VYFTPFTKATTSVELYLRAILTKSVLDIPVAFPASDVVPEPDKKNLSLPEFSSNSIVALLLTVPSLPESLLLIPSSLSIEA